MDVAILGGGITGLTAAHYERKNGNNVVLFEKEKTLGGLAGGFYNDGWEWPLERAYHHLFTTDGDILNFSKEIGFNGIFFKEPETESLYHGSIIPFAGALDLLRFPYLPLIDKLRLGSVIAFLKTLPFLPLYEKMTTEEFLGKYAGEHAFEEVFGELFRKKFGKYAGNILASWFWARFKVRSKKLGYISGGFQTFVDYVAQKNREKGVEIKIGQNIASLEKKKDTILVDTIPFDKLIITLPTPIVVKIGASLFPKEYIKQLSSIEYMNATNLIIESKKPLLDNTYWLNVCDRSIPITVLVQHTNFIESSHYGGSHILYVGNYVENGHKFLSFNNKEALEFFSPYLNNLKEGFTDSIKNTFFLKAAFAQPIFDKNFIQVKPTYITPVKNVYMANLDMTYPNDRGTNYAVALGREVSRISR